MERGPTSSTTFSPGTESPGDIEMSCLTPRRRLSLDKPDKNSPSTSSESGYCDSMDVSSPSVSCDTPSSPDSVFFNNLPLRDITADSNVGAVRRRHTASRRASRLRCCSAAADKCQRQQKLQGCFKVPVLPFNDRPASLPTFSTSPRGDKQIRSPMGNLAISSPSDGYDLELLSNSAEHSVDGASGSSMVSPTAQFITTAVTESRAVLKPTPVRPAPMLGGKCFQRQLSVASIETSFIPTKRLVPSPNRGNVAKRSPLPLTESLPSSSSSSSQPLEQHAATPFTRSMSCVMPPLSYTDDADEEKLIGDHSKLYCLPIEKSTNPADLKCISPQTMADVISGAYDDVINSYRIVDCRYPYEFDAGHIKGAQNIWNKDDLMDHFLSDPKYPQDDKRDIIIFHCEFSSKRGPDMSRFLRKMDRKQNGIDFPKLYFPELYLVQGGYSLFFESFHELCIPAQYCRMADDRHLDDCKYFSKRSKSWSGENNKRRCPSLSARRHTVLGDNAKSSASRQL